MLPLLTQLARAPGAPGGGWRGSVAILADRPKPEMDEVLREELWDKGYRLDVQTREGVPFKPADLQHVAAHRARHIILLQGQGANAPAAEALGAAAAMSLATLPASKEQSIVVQVPGVVPSGAEVLLSLASSAGLAAVQSRFRWGAPPALPRSTQAAARAPPACTPPRCCRARAHTRPAPPPPPPRPPGRWRRRARCL